MENLTETPLAKAGLVLEVNRTELPMATVPEDSNTT